MNKKIGIIKRLTALLLIFLLSINSFAAVVSDNDGSAFITKAEFDSLKNNFQSQIDQYNTSIDSKIDGAIAQYLAGIQVSSTQQVVLCNGKDMRVVFFTPSVQGNNWKRGRMGMDISETACGLGKRSGSYDYFTNFSVYRDGSLYPFEALIKDPSTNNYFYCDNYVLNYKNKLCNFYASVNKTLNLYGLVDKELAWGATYLGTCTQIDDTGTGSRNGGAGMISHYPLRADWFKVAPDHCLGEVAAKAWTTNTYNLSDTTNKIYSNWTVEPSFSDNFNECRRDFFITQGPDVNMKFWKQDLTTITTVADITSGWTDSSDASRIANLPSTFGITVPYVYSCTSLAQTTNMAQQAYGAGAFAEQVAISGYKTWTSSTLVDASDYIEPELQMSEVSIGSMKWTGAADWANLLDITFNGYPYDGYPVVKWDTKWKTLQVDVDNSNSKDMIINFRSVASASNQWINAQGGSELVISIDGVDQGKTYGTLTPGPHTIVITPKTSFANLWVKVGWSSTTEKDRGYFHMPLNGMALCE